jgi:RNA-directed DNA polymerase
MKKQTIRKRTYLEREVVNPQRNLGGLSKQEAQLERYIHVEGITKMDLLEKILKRENLLSALQRVEKNKGKHGIDEMTVDQLRGHIMLHWNEIRQAILDGTFHPMAVRRVEIPKPNGGVRLLGIPTVTDRMIQQAISQVLTPIFDPTFSDHSYGFRPGRKQHDAVKKAQSFLAEGYRWVVDIDLEKFFDKVNHDKLMSLIAKRIDDKRVLLLIRRFLQSGVMISGLEVISEEGVPQGGPLSPLLSNIMLDELDKELEKRGHRFVRFADDCNIYVKSRKAGLRVKEAMTIFLEKKLKLKVNEKKSAVERPWRRKFLGFSFTSNKVPKVRVAKEALKKCKGKIRELTSRSYYISMEMRIEKLNKSLVGWVNYFSLADTPTPFKELDKYLRRRLRMCRWKEWKNPRTKIKRLISLGISKEKAFEWGNSRKQYWRISKSPILHTSLGNLYWKNLGLKSMLERYYLMRQT